MYSTLEIHQKDPEKKGRAFRVHLIAYMLADAIVPPPNTGYVLRPILFAYVGTASAVKAFTANLRSGETAIEVDHDRHGRKFELMRSLGYRYELSATPAGTLCVAYLPEPFHLRPGSSDVGRIQFVSAPATWWLDDQVQRLKPDHGDRAREVARALAFAAYLDQRTPLPIANDVRFHEALFAEARKAPWTLEPGCPAFRCEGLEALGLESPVLTNVDELVFSSFLADVTTNHLPKEQAHGAHRLPSTRRVLPYAQAPLVLDRLDDRARRTA